MESWSLKWLRGCEFRGLTFHNNRGERVVDVDKITTSKGVLPIVGARDLGRMEVHRPRLALPTPPAHERRKTGSVIQRQDDYPVQPKSTVRHRSETRREKTKSRAARLLPAGTVRIALFPYGSRFRVALRKYKCAYAG